MLGLSPLSSLPTTSEGDLLMRQFFVVLRNISSAETTLEAISEKADAANMLIKQANAALASAESAAVLVTENADAKLKAAEDELAEARRVNRDTEFSATQMREAASDAQANAEEASTLEARLRADLRSVQEERDQLAIAQQQAALQTKGATQASDDAKKAETLFKTKLASLQSAAARVIET